ncbi:MAG TPA: hypothetical protein P5204_00310 [Kiritimatiellia bacterium]|nr:hypothetical protein [Kiritimatiellia bacterium]
MVRRLLPLAWFLLAAATASARSARLPLDPAALAGAEVFTAAEAHVAAAAQAAGLAFVADPRPLPPQVLLTLDTAAGDVQKRDGLLYWRGEMLPDQLAPGETGTLVRRRRAKTGDWKTVRTQADVGPASRADLVPAARTAGTIALPAMIIETPYRLGAAGDCAATLVLWRTADEDSAPLAGCIVLDQPPPALAAALAARLPDFPARADWADAFAAYAR